MGNPIYPWHGQIERLALVVGAVAVMVVRVVTVMMVAVAAAILCR